MRPERRTDGEGPAARDRHATPQFLTPGEVERLLRESRGTVHRDIIYFLVRTGARAAELAALRWEDVDLDKRVIRLGGRHDDDGRRPYLARRAIPIDDELARIISRQPGGPDFEDPGYGVPRRTRRSLLARVTRRPEFVFAAESGGPRRSGLDRGIRRAAELAGLTCAGRPRVGPRMLRHTFAAQLVMNGADTGVLREVLGLARAEHLARYRSLARDRPGTFRIPRGRPLRPGRPEAREHLDERKRRFVQSFRPRIGVPRELEEVERMIERLEDETRSLASCRRTRRRLTAIVEEERRTMAPGWIEILFEEGDGPAEAPELLEEAKLVIDARRVEDAELKEALARLDGLDGDLRDWSGRLVSDLGLAIRMFGRAVFPRPVCPAGGFPEPAEFRRRIEELAKEVKHASYARELSAGGGQYTRQVHARAPGPPRRAGGIP